MSLIDVIEYFLQILPEALSRKLMDLGIKDYHVIIETIVFLTCLTGLIVFFCLLFTHAHYGRYTPRGTCNYPFLWYGVNAKVAWFLQEFPAFFISVAVIYNEFVTNATMPLIKVLLAGLYSLHYFQRALVYPFLIRGGKSTPLLLFLLAVLYCSVQGYAQPKGIILSHYDGSQMCTLRICVGVIIFFIGMAINIHADHILRNLRSPGETGYKIPKGGMFKYVSGANFFGEIVEWIGFAIAAQTGTAFSFALFTICNIGPRAWHHHRWYKEKFEDYPTERRAVIPFII